LAALILAVMTILTISFSERKAGLYTANAGQTVFFFAFPILADNDIDVWRERAGTATLLTLGWTTPSPAWVNLPAARSA